jgi:hypothetical protein
MAALLKTIRRRFNVMFSAKKSLLTRPPNGVLSSSVRSIAESYLSTANMTTPAAGGALTINGLSLGNHDYIVKQGAQTIASFTESSWFTATADTASAWVIINGNLTINSPLTFRPAARKLFMVVYVNGNLSVNGSISMTARGANHAATPPQNILIAQGTFSGVSNPFIPATGGAGAGTAGTFTSYPGAVNGNNGTDGTVGGSGGGGSGSYGRFSVSDTSTGGAGSAGTCFSGGSGGGSAPLPWSATANANLSASAGASNGGAGGAGTATAGSAQGVGNPGSGVGGTGGTLIIICTGQYSGIGSVAANGSTFSLSSNCVAAQNFANPGASGGGSVTILAATLSGPTPTATGGLGGSGACAASGGAGGNGSVRQLLLV